MKTSPDCSHWREAIRAWIAEGLAGEEVARVETHLKVCAACRRYADELRATAAGLRWLADQPANLSPGFRARWIQAVEDAARPRGFGEAAAALLDWSRGLLLRDLRPALGMASLWILALLFRLTAPDVAPATPAAVARSPIEIARALGADQRLAAWQLRREEPLPLAPRPPQSPQPRSERAPARPSAQSDRLPDARANVDRVFPGLLAQSRSSSLPQQCQT